ncbi:MAG: hypothetical protein E7015_02605 [Alphaproteobacteria bacterium]|nr:hypothetical protein [Alphaproteobacteria bacterium]
MQRDQDDLFDNDIKCFCMRNVEDKHLELVLGLNHSNNIFILESGDYFKSKKITSELQKDQKFYAIASFNNDITLMSICKMLLPQQSQQIHNEIIKIIKVTDEGLVSLFRKISLLLDENAFQNLKNYITYKRSFIDELELIPLVRYALQAAIKEEVFHQDQSYTKMNLKNKIHFLMNVERRQKRMYMLNRNYVLHELQYNK